MIRPEILLANVNNIVGTTTGTNFVKSRSFSGHFLRVSVINIILTTFSIAPPAQITIAHHHISSQELCVLYASIDYTSVAA